MGLLSVLTTIFTNVWPFLRESVFKSASFKRWITEHIYSLIWLIIVTIMFLAGYQLFKAATSAHIELRNERTRTAKLTQQVAALRQSSSNLNTREVNVLRTTIAAQQARIVQYEHWMTLCGMDYQSPQRYPDAIPVCASTIIAKPAPTKKPKSTVKRKAPVTTVPKPKPGHITDQVQDIWNQP